MCAGGYYEMRVSALIMTAALLGSGLTLRADDRETYKVDFTIRDSGDAGGKAGRKYSLLVNRGLKTVFKVGNRVPVVTGGTNGGALVNTQFTYIDIGMNIDCTVAENGAKFDLHSDMDISTAVAPDKNSAVQNPTISQIKLSLDTSVPAGKPTVVASFDDPVTSRKFDIDVAIANVVGQALSPANPFHCYFRNSSAQSSRPGAAGDVHAGPSATPIGMTSPVIGWNHSAWYRPASSRTVALPALGR